MLKEDAYDFCLAMKEEVDEIAKAQMYRVSLESVPAYYALSKHQTLLAFMMKSYPVTAWRLATQISVLVGPRYDDDDTDMMQRKHDCYYLIYEFFKEVMEG